MATASSRVTSRGSIQIRGLNAASAPRFAAAVAGLGIAAADGIPVLINPLAGLDAEDILDAGALAADLRLALAQTLAPAELSAKVSVAIDGGGTVDLDGIAADVRLRARAQNGVAALDVSVARRQAARGSPRLRRRQHGSKLPSVCLRLLRGSGRAARARDPCGGRRHRVPFRR